ncbi:endonuclease/exonuclease/phosphatase family protein [Tabrizicola sp.]|uniref:endonuclease/exonuclease/phosphatase family protein n=1 Tax=Tabrizicola sp. TaxID=2005166 RepID=UPI002FDE2D3F
MITATTGALAILSQEDRAKIAALPRDMETHDAHMAGLATMTEVELGGQAGGPLTLPLTIAAWNLERCLFPEASAAKLAATGAGLILLSEMDKGMARTAQRHPTAEIAASLGMAYAYGVEFVELGLGSETERGFCTDNFNALGLHGNALMAGTALRRPFLLRLPSDGHWFLNGGDQPRLGARMAIGAVVETTAGPLITVSTHLESVARPAGRAVQMAAILDAIDSAFPGLPVVIGGDLNTGNFPGGSWRDETLFDEAMARGYSVHGGPEEAVTTRPSLITRWPDRAMKLDWFLTRGLRTGLSRIEPSLDAEGRPLSDHDMVILSVAGIG